MLPFGKSTTSIINQVAFRYKGGAQELFFDLLQEWIKLMGSEANSTQIEMAFKELGNNDALNKFKTYMR